MNNFEQLNKEMLKTLIDYEIEAQRKEARILELEKQLKNVRFLLDAKSKLEAKADKKSNVKLYALPDFTYDGEKPKLRRMNYEGFNGAKDE